MIDYGAKAGEPEWHMLFRVTGSVFPRCLMIVIPLSILAVTLKLLHSEDILTEITAMTFTKDGTAWGGFSGLVNFVVVFRLSAAYSTYWAAYSTTNGMLGDWSGAASSVVVFCRHAKVDPEIVQAFLQKIVRLFSMLSACALQELSPREHHKVWGLLTLNCEGIDGQTLASLDGSSMRVDLCYHWIQQLLVDNQESGVLAAPAPIVGRAFGELGAGMGKFGDAKKHATCQFNFPYAQATTWLLILYSALMPMMMVQWSDWVCGAFVFTFLQLNFIWALHFITLGMESPFDTSNPNYIDLYQLQLGMNKALLLLLEPATRTPELKEKETERDQESLVELLQSAKKDKDYRQLQKRDTIHKAVLKKEGWQLHDKQADNDGVVRSLSRTTSFQTQDGCCSFCRPAKAPRAEEFAVCKKFCTKRYGIIHGAKTAVKTAVIPVGIFGDKLIVAIPPRLEGLRFTVENTFGHACEVVITAIAICDRHKLLSKLPQGEDEREFEKFPCEYKQLEADVSNAKTNFAALPVSKVSSFAELEVEKKIEEMKDADKKGAGIDKIAALKSREVFIKQLIEKCSLDPQTAEQEWERRKNLPEKYEQARDDQDRVIIELDTDRFMKELQRQKEEVKANVESLKTAKASGEPATLEKARKNASDDLPGLPKDQADLLQVEIKAADATLDTWRQLNEVLENATKDRDLETLRTTIKTAKKAGLQSRRFADAEKLVLELEQEEIVRKQTEAAQKQNKDVQKQNEAAQKPKEGAQKPTQKQKEDVQTQEKPEGEQEEQVAQKQPEAQKEAPPQEPDDGETPLLDATAVGSD